MLKSQFLPLWKLKTISVISQFKEHNVLQNVAIYDILHTCLHFHSEIFVFIFSVSVRKTEEIL